MGNTYMPKPENRYPNNGSGFEHIWELDMLKSCTFYALYVKYRKSNNFSMDGNIWFKDFTI